MKIQKMKLIGVRSSSRHFCGLYSQELQRLRIQAKPGLLSGPLVGGAQTLEEVENNEIE